MMRQLLATAVFNSTGVTMSHGDEGWNNLLADRLTTRGVYLIDPISFSISNLTQMQERYPVKILFLQKTQLDYSPAQQAAATDLARIDCRAFIAYVRDAEEFQNITNINSVETWNLFDANVSGWLLTCDIDPVPTESPC